MTFQSALSLNGLKDALVDEDAVADASPQGVDQRLRRSQDVIQQPHLAKPALLRQMEAEEIVGQRIGDEVEEPDLVTGGETALLVGDLLSRQIRLLQQRPQRDPGALRARARQPGDESADVRQAARARRATRSHGALREGSPAPPATFDRCRERTSS